MTCGDASVKDRDRQVIRTRGGKVSCRMAGEGRALLLMHGIAGNSASWQDQLRSLSDRFRVIAWDAPGYGASDVTEPTLPDYAAVAINLLDALDIDRAHVLGHSMGGVIAQGLAGLAPERVDRLVLSSTFAGDAASGPLSAHWQSRLDAFRQMSPAQYGRARARAMVSASASETIRNNLAEIASEVTEPGLHAGCLLLHQSDTRPMAKQITMPVLVLYGSDDTVIAPERTQALAAWLPDSQLVCIPAAGHAAYTECPEQYNAIVREFLEDQGFLKSRSA